MKFTLPWLEDQFDTSAVTVSANPLPATTQGSRSACPLPLVGRGAGVGGGSACGLNDGAYRPTAPLTLPSPHKGERGDNRIVRLVESAP